MIKKIIKQIIGETQAAGGQPPKMVVIDPSAMGLPEPTPEPELRSIGLFSDIQEEKVSEIIHAMLYLNELNRVQKNPDKIKPIDFYLCTYGGSADDMFALYDIMKTIRETTEIHTHGLGKVMSAGVLILASGTKGKRKIGKHCRVMIHSVIAGNHGPLHNLVNEMDAIQQLQEIYINCLVNETKMTETQLKNMLEQKVNIYLSAEEAVELGIADIIV
jgi:ATP-dependent Clp endopeptidase proteolytic subunit ClpP